MPDFSGLKYPLVAGFGAVIGLLPSTVLAFGAIYVPALWPWVFAPTALGTVCGLIWATWFVD